MDFAPVDEEQAGLQQFLADRFGHVSYERLLSGDGLVNIYEYLSGKDVSGIKAAWVNQEAQQGSEIAQYAMRVFVRIYGAYVGNLALLFRPEGGIYITGGIASKMIEQICSEDFINAYLYKGRMQHVVEQVAVSLVTNERVGVIGAISEAVRLQQDNK
jgi:glucokinase